MAAASRSSGGIQLYRLYRMAKIIGTNTNPMNRIGGDRSLLRQAYTSTFGHCNFSPAELVAGVLALSHRVTTGSWEAVADPASLNRVAAGLNLGAARFAEDYSPSSLTGAIGANNAPPSQG